MATWCGGGVASIANVDYQSAVVEVAIYFASVASRQAACYHPTWRCRL